MASSSTHDITGLLHDWGGGNDRALARLVPLVYAELRRRARRYMDGERPSHTLQPTALVNEVYLRLVDCQDMGWKDRAHFFAMCARLMRRILTDLARSRRYDKRGGKAQHVTLNTSLIFANAEQPDLADLDEALKRLHAMDSRKSDVVELRFFGGLSVKETAQVLQVSADTVMRDWRLAKVWLLRELSSEK
ncbi:MAG TPA: sigma-70 family RNA polymerase sigma factor [Terriglobia bacterium]|nr:sigma-70 family RNA polymerase sigma factor [Terriglobia bacterium]